MLLLVSVALCVYGSPIAATPQFGIVDVFPAIPEVRAVHGVARAALAVVLDPATTNPTFEYEGRAGVAPTIRVHPGDTIDLTVRNDARPANGRTNAINIHFTAHGVAVGAGRRRAHDLARYGEVLHYRVRIPADHETGLYWYHPHVHGESYADVTGGMSAARGRGSAAAFARAGRDARAHHHAARRSDRSGRCE